MSNEEFFGEFGNELLVLNGVDYSVNNHSPGARYMATGKLDSLAYRFDIVLRGRRSTMFENRMEGN